MPNSNRKIDNLILSFGEAHIDLEYGLRALNDYLHDLELLAAGVPYSNLGISSRRASSGPSLISIQNNQYEELPFSEIKSRGGLVSHLRISGVMRTEDGMSSRGMNSFADDLRTADQFPTVIAHVIEINSGGGQATAGAVAMNAIADAKKPVIVVGHTVGSAAYMATLGADRTYAATEASRFGSIGSFLTLDRNFAGWYRENFQDLYADVSVQKNKEFRAYLDGDTGPLQQMVNESAREFQQLVQSNRQLKGGDVKIKDTLEGGMFAAPMARRRGLIDGFATVNDAAAEASLLAKSGARRKWQGTQNSNLMEIKQALEVVNRFFAADEPKAEVKAEPTAGVMAALQSIQSGIDGLSTRVEKLETATPQNEGNLSERIQAMQTSIDALSGRLEAMEQKHTELASEIAGGIADDLKQKKQASDRSTGTERKFEETIGRNTRSAIRVVGGA